MHGLLHAKGENILPIHVCDDFPSVKCMLCIVCRIQDVLNAISVHNETVPH